MAILKSPVMLTILDGFGLGDIQDITNAVVQAHPENFKALYDGYAHTQLQASGLAVGLPEGQMGNSEVGHLNIGAGRIVYQELTRITKDTEEGTFFEKAIIKELYAKAKNSRLQIIGLLSDGGVHSSLDHIKAIIKGAKDAGITSVYVHALLDGRDVPPKSALTYVHDLESFMSDLGLGQIATIGGRYYGMDRDKRWERVEQAYKAIVDGEGAMAKTATAAVEASYAQDVVDEFVVPVVVHKEGSIEANDGVIFANFRPDRARQLTRAIVDPDFTGFTRKKGVVPVYFATMTKYEEGLPVHIVYEKEVLTNTLGQVLSDGGYTQLRIAETEKYAHVTYFFNGGEEEPFKGEERILVPSPKVATYDMQPEMSAYEVTDKVVAAIESKAFDMIVLNFANPDMVGHTGDFEAAKKAVQTVDTCLGRIAEAIKKVQGHLLITADHGNSEMMIDHSTGAPHTAHTTNPVPLILVSDIYTKEDYELQSGRLCDLAPTMLYLGGIEQPSEMTGQNLVHKK
ncbi:2,3-bisphosphoglycerate-independent phosphoglycerate mutase [uncultured Veillonella sp.]|uniref:2,3-bisphosphoglycerate-independent phosphoglycerate mutase n=1 Tax=uncultured Veillonella sp. TaxID=159268 RepID=UPI00261C6D97|nr:2,3-bisphosphoglycerate-independent phosphoglycerate mutase [uncultured Veillonella sp.]